MSEFPARYCKKEKEVTPDEIKERDQLISEFVDTFTDPNVARMNIGYSTCAAFCKLVISEEDLEKNVPPALRTGLLEKAGTYDGIIRLNVTTESAVRMTIRINVPIHVGGPMLEEAAPSAYPDKYKQVDILMADELKEFIADEYKDMIHVLSLRNGPTAKEVLSAIWNLPGVIGVAKGSKHAKDVLHHDLGIVGKNYYGGLPYRLGESGAMKWGMISQQEHILSEEEKLEDLEDVNASSKSLFNSMKKWMAEHKEGAKWNFSIQIADNGEDGKYSDEFNLESGSAHWDESKSPFVTVGTFIIPSDQEFAIDTDLNKFLHPEDDETTSKPEFNTVRFSPWNQLAAHRPLGPYQRARYYVYKACSKRRWAHGNGEEEPKLCPFLEMMKK